LDSGDKVAEKESAEEYIARELEALGLTALASEVWAIIQEKRVPTNQMAAEIRKLPAYTRRFPANDARIKAGLRPLSPAEYFDLEENYRDILQNYGLPSKYYLKSDPLASQPDLDRLISVNVNAETLERRLIQGVNEIQNKPAEYLDAIQTYYPEIGRGDILAYVLDPKNAEKDIKAKVAAAQIGGEYLRAGSARPGGMGPMVAPTAARAEELARSGVTAEAARTVAQAIPDAQRGAQLARMQGVEDYGQSQVEEELYGLGRAPEARRQRQQIGARERSLYEGRSGLGQGALARDRAGQN
jgi:hypothetical protein